jgi:hypothetical protein
VPKLEYWPNRQPFSQLAFLQPAVQHMHRDAAMRREQRRRHVVLYVAHGNRMRCRLNRDSVLDTLHVQPPLHHSIDCFFRTTIRRAEGPFVGRRLHFRHAVSARFTRGALCKTSQKHALYTSRSVLREHLRGGQEGA